MLRALQALNGFAVESNDGQILGDIRDFYFDDGYWTIRYLVIDTGSWLSKKEKLISPLVIADPKRRRKTLAVKLTKEQLADSPDVEVDLPVSRQHEAELANHYHWPVYWETGGMAAIPPLPNAMARHLKTRESETKGDPHLRSSSEVCGYSIFTNDGKMGHVEDFIVEDDTWVIRYMVVDTKDWLPGKKVLVAPEWLTDVKLNDRKVQVDLSREEIRKSPEYDAYAHVNRKYEEQLYDYYGRPAYWADKREVIAGKSD